MQQISRQQILIGRTAFLVYHRKKRGPVSEPCRLTIGKRLRALLNVLAPSGDLFPNIKRTSANHRSAEFRRRCRVADVDGVSLHSYRHAWAQRAKACGYPQRFAQEALGHNSRSVHEAYAKGALVVLPALEAYEQTQTNTIIPLHPHRSYVLSPSEEPTIKHLRGPFQSKAFKESKCRTSAVSV
jgi:integrase